MFVKSHPRLIAATLATLCLPLSASAPALARPADWPVPDTAAPQQKVGDTPADFGKDVSVPQYVEVVKPERTIIRDAVPALPIVLSGMALLVALLGAAAARRSARAH